VFPEKSELYYKIVLQDGTIVLTAVLILTAPVQFEMIRSVTVCKFVNHKKLFLKGATDLQKMYS